jgi:hypothetical protein
MDFYLFLSVLFKESKPKRSEAERGFVSEAHRLMHHIRLFDSYTSFLFYMSGCSEGTLLPVFDLRQKRHHVRNIPDGIQLIRSNLLRRNRAVPLSPIYHFGLSRKCHRLINQPFDDIFWDRQFADAQSDETYKADFTLVGDIDIGLSFGLLLFAPISAWRTSVFHVL